MANIYLATSAAEIILMLLLSAFTIFACFMYDGTSFTTMQSPAREEKLKVDVMG